jgi:homoserine O-succinyltransferase/O-acetyltransferase
MPLVANSNLPSFDRLKQDGETIISADQALHQDIRELHIGLLNMMPDTALEATERQFFRLVGESNQIAQFYLHPFTLNELERSTEGKAHVEKYYQSFDQIKEQGLDALIITGANMVGSELADQPFWNPLSKVMEWAHENVTSTLCSCLTTHAVLQFRYHQKRKPLSAKRWGVFPHRVVDRKHPLVVGVNTRFDVPHSRFNEVFPDQFKAAGLKILVESEDNDVHLAVSEDGFRLVFFQGHPEYDLISLMKEYKREVGRYIDSETDQYPPFPENYFSLKCQAILEEYQDTLNAALKQKIEPPEFPEELIIPYLDNTWHDTAEAVINNWIGKVYQLTNTDRHIPFNSEIDPEDPLGLKIL